MRFRCPFCMYIIKTSQSYRGQKMKCPSCEQTVLVPKTSFEEGCIIGDFVIRAKVGEGSIGTVYRADQISLERTVALKVLSPEYTNVKGVSDFLREARRAAKLSHPNLVQALAVGEEDGTCYMAMNYLTGETVKRRIERDGRMPVDESLHVVQQVAEALYYAWDESGLIHRDVKPENIIITEDGIVKLTDLGLAMNETEWSEDMEISGSPSYMSPEQFSGEKLDTRSDIYSLGITLYQMLSGRLPFDGQTVRTVAKQHFTENAVSLAKLDPKVPQKVASLVKKMIAKHPDDRFGTMEELLTRVWTIRQRTAPDKSLVPDVHTISIKRLDYDIQKESVQNKRRAKRQARKERERSNRMLLGFIAVAVLVLCVIIIIVVKMQQQRAALRPLAKRVAALSEQVQEHKVDPEYLRDEAERILTTYGKDETPEVQMYLAQVRLCLAKMDTWSLQDRIEDMKQKHVNDSRLIEELKKTASKPPVQVVNPQEAEENRKLRDQLKKMQNKLKQLEGKTGKLTHDVRSLSQQKNALQKDLWSGQAQDILAKSFSLIRQGLPEKALALYELEKAEGVPPKSWLDKKKAWLENLVEVHTLLTSSGGKYAGTVLGNDSKLQMIEDGNVYFQDQTGAINEMNWRELGYENALIIAKKGIKDLDENQFKARWLLLTGNLGGAVQVEKVDPVVIEMTKASLIDVIRKMKYAAVVDPKKVQSKAIGILKQFEGCELKTIQEELTALKQLAGEATPE